MFCDFAKKCDVLHVKKPVLKREFHAFLKYLSMQEKWWDKQPPKKPSSLNTNQLCTSFFCAHNQLKHEKNCNFGTMHCFPQRLKSTFFKKFPTERPWRSLQSEEKNSKSNDCSIRGNCAATYTHTIYCTIFPFLVLYSRSRKILNIFLWNYRSSI